MPSYELWRCKYCRELFVVPTLARQHEAIHEREGAADARREDPS